MSTDLNRPGSVKPVAAAGQQPDLNRGVKTRKLYPSKASPSQPERDKSFDDLVLDDITESGRWYPKSEPIILYAPEDLARLRAFYATCGLLAGILAIGASSIVYVTVQGYDVGGLTWFYGTAFSSLTASATLYFRKANPTGRRRRAESRR
jgi:hypothetical protein